MAIVLMASGLANRGTNMPKRNESEIKGIRMRFTMSMNEYVARKDASDDKNESEGSTSCGSIRLCYRGNNNPLASDGGDRYKAFLFRRSLLLVRDRLWRQLVFLHQGF